jgi:hypothetical protein
MPGSAPKTIVDEFGQSYFKIIYESYESSQHQMPLFGAESSDSNSSSKY